MIELISFVIRFYIYVIITRTINSYNACSLHKHHVSSGSVIYGRIMVDPQQSLGSAYHVSIEKIFVCSGLDGYIPQYSPDSGEYGCPS